jgi:hypothetical protein
MMGCRTVLGDLVGRERLYLAVQERAENDVDSTRYAAG